MAHNGPSPASRQAVNHIMKIEIYDQVYNVSSEQDEEYLKELAAFVDGKMRSVAEATRMVDSLKVAVLASLNVADELFTLRRRQQEIEGPLRKRVEKCVAMVEKALEQSN
jgi:cell division protein ZapA